MVVDKVRKAPKRAPTRRVWRPTSTFKRSQIHQPWLHDLFTDTELLAQNPLFQRLNKRNIKTETKQALTGIKTEESALADNPLYARLNPGTRVGSNKQWNIKGAAATTVIIRNLAQGTTTEDVKTSLAALGCIQACTISPMGRSPLVQAEVTFSLRSEAKAAVEQLHQALADGNVLSVFIKEK